MKRFLLFFGNTFYPSGGMKDFGGEFDTIDQAKNCLLDHKDSWDWWHILDTTDYTLVTKYSSSEKVQKKQ